MKEALVIEKSRSNTFFFSEVKKRIMIKKKHLLIIVAWLIAAVSIIIPRFANTVSTNTTNVTLDDIVNSINGLKSAIYIATGMKIVIIVTVMVIIKAIKK